MNCPDRLAPYTFILGSPGTLIKPVRHEWRWHRQRVKASRCIVIDCLYACDPHHLTFVQPKARGLTAGDQWIVPLCRIHHDYLHQFGDERAVWDRWDIDPVPHAIGHWIWSLYLKNEPWEDAIND